MPRAELFHRTPALCCLLALLTGCGGLGYYYVGSCLEPTPEQAQDMIIADDGGVTYSRGRLDLRLRAVSVDELNRQFASTSAAGSTNPYTYGGDDGGDGPTPVRFTVFHLSVKNYAYPKVVLDPARIELMTSNRRQYWSLGLQQLEAYYRTYVTGYRGNEYTRYQQRVDLLRRTMFKAEPVFSGQEAAGYVVFPPLHDDVTKMRVTVHDAVLRFDFHGEPVELIDISYDFEREVDKVFGLMPARGA